MSVIFLDIFHVTRLYQYNSTCLLAAQPASRYSYINDHSFPRLQNLKNPSATRHATRHAYCRDLTRLCLRLCILYWSQTERERMKAGPSIACHSTRAPPLGRHSTTFWAPQGNGRYPERGPHLTSIFNYSISRPGYPPLPPLHTIKCLRGSGCRLGGARAS